MSLPVVPTCDKCGAQKKTANHWFVAFLSNIGVRIEVWGENHAAPNAFHLCGLDCANKWMLEQLDKLNRN